MPIHWEARMGGAEYQAKLLLERLLALDRFDIHYVARETPVASAAHGYSTHRIPGSGRIAGVFLPDVPGLWRLLAKLQPDIIYQRVGCAYTGVAAHYARKFGRRMVWHVAHDHDVMPVQWRWSLRMPLRLLDRALLDYGVRHADAIVVQTCEQARLLQRHFGRTPTAHISNFHPAPAETLARPDDRVRVCWIASLKPWKHPELFVRLARDLRHRTDVEFVMAGQPPSRRREWEELQREIHALPNLRYLGEQPIEAINDLLARSHIMVNTSEHEGFANTFIQSWMRGVPVVSLKVNPDGVFAGDRCGICAGGSYAALLEAVRRLIDDRALRECIGARAQAIANETFSMANADRLIGVLDPWHTGRQR